MPSPLGHSLMRYIIYRGTARPKVERSSARDCSRNADFDILGRNHSRHEPHSNTYSQRAAQSGGS